MSLTTSFQPEQRSKISVNSLLHSDQAPSPSSDENTMQTMKLPALEELFASDLLISNQVGRYRPSDYARSQDGQQHTEKSRQTSPLPIKKDLHLDRLQLPYGRRTDFGYQRQMPPPQMDLPSPSNYQYGIPDYNSVASHSLPSTPGFAPGSWSTINDEWLSDKEDIKQQRSDSLFTDSFNKPQSRRSSPVYALPAHPEQQEAGLHPATYVYQPYQSDYQGIQMISGKGPHHIYASGYCIPTHVQGKYVDPTRGLTRAKIPRRRLSTACSVCRKKKIRCEPTHDGGCLQCKKADRECKV